jgi:hydrogenase-4 component B
VVSELPPIAVLLWAASAILALVGSSMLSRVLLVAGVVASLLAAIASLPAGSPTIILPIQLIGEQVSFRVDPEGLWLMGFGLVPAGFAELTACSDSRTAPHC